ncbi:hypothetical protein G210_0713 [Candida maltosa Xu316]|uniref:Major facilitator superfamily (MFS) profile domain-containing protein n=1 Tax=Candida maltosa (strain Xu316) TaxID=1245528 RepID=M3HML4_CANMX|nr:hypothetical protein G210_0713 [Candida maltosa Xu316]
MATEPQQQQQQPLPHHHIQIKESWLVGKALLNFTSLFVTLGVVSFGFEQGLYASLITNKYFEDYYHDPKPAEIGIMVAILELGALFSSFLAAQTGDLLGRKRAIRYGAAIFSLGGFIQCISPNIFTLSIARLISGIGIGFLTTIVPMYQSEISPAEDRGFYACVEFTGNIVGYASSIWVDYGFSFLESDLSWQAPLMVQFGLGVLLWAGTFIIVETPRWLLNHDHNLEGMIVIADLYSDGDVEDDHAKEEYRNIKEGVLIDRIEGGERSYQYLFKRYAKRLSVACFGLLFAQLNGINLISYYAPMIFESAGWVGREAIFMAGINSIVYLISTIPPWYLVDSWGRKPLLMSGALIMGIPLYIAGYSLYLNDTYTAAIVVSCIIITNAGFGFSWGGIGWLLPSEVLPLSVRSKGAALATATNWLSNFIVGFASPVLLDLIKWKTYWIPATSCIISFFAVWYLFPETKGLSLEEMGSVFDDKSSIFSYHASGSLGGGSNGSIYGSANVDETFRNDSAPPVSGIPEPFQKSAASMARNPGANPQFDGIITGAAPPPMPNPNSLKPIKSDFSDSHSFDNTGNSSDIVQEIEPPTLEEILKFKVDEQSQPNIFKLSC